MAFLRLSLALILLGMPLYLGFQAVSIGMIIPVSFIFLATLISGKWKQWNLHWQNSNPGERTKNILITYVVQLVFVSVLFFMGLGIGKAFNDHPSSTTTTSHALAVVGVISGLVLLGNVVIHFWEKNSIQSTANANEISMSDDDDLVMSSEPVTEANFFHGIHFSISDHSMFALNHWPNENGEKIKRSPVAANTYNIEQTENRLGFKLPEKLRRLYMRQNGGSLPTYWVPATENPSGSYDDWIDAFAFDYDDLRPLESLTILMDSYMEDFDPEYDDESLKDSWLPEAEKFVVLTQRYGVATLLDYRKSNTDPGVALVDLEKNIGEKIRKTYPSFDAFFEDLRKQEDDSSHGHGTIDTIDRNTLSDESYNPGQPHRFWANATSNASHGISDKDWSLAEKRLGVTLPVPFKPLYKALDGGTIAYPFHPSLGTEEDREPHSPFKGKLYSTDGLIALHKWISLKEFSDRLDFKGEKPYADEHASPDKLIIIAASYDSALMLDYRNKAGPRVVYCQNLTNAKTCIDLDTPETFLKSLRKRKNPSSNDPLPMSDAQLSPRVQNPDTFWINDPERSGANQQALDNVAARFGKEIPEAFSNVLKRQNGEQVRFRFAPPVGNHQDTIGRPRNDWMKTKWVNMFPGGVWPIENWKTFSEFRQVEGVALQQDFRSDLMPEMSTEPDVTERLIVVGMSKERHITLLDLSEGYFKRTPFLARADYDENIDAYRLTIAPISISHHTQGVFATLRAKIDELE